MADNLAALVVHLRSRPSTASGSATPTIECTFGETRRRVKVIGRPPGEQSCLSLTWAVLDQACKGWRGLTMTPRRCADYRTCGANCSTSNDH